MTALAVLTQRCTGHCCRKFPVSASLEELRRIAGGYTDSDNEAAKIADMLIPLGVEDFDGTMKPVYTCRHHNVMTGDCSIYESRPRMCRDYPHGRACQHADCTMRGTP